MSLKERIAARLKALFAGVALSKKSIEAITEQQSKGLTDESTDEDIDAKLNARNEIYSFDDQRKYDDYLAGKATKEAADKEAARLKAIEEGKPAPEEIDPNETKTEKMLRLMMEKMEKQDQAIAAMAGEKVANTRREQVAKLLENTTDAYKADKLADFDLMGFKDDESFETYKTSLEGRTKDFVKTEGAEDGISAAFRPTGSAGGKPAGQIKVATTEVVDEIMGLI